MIARLVDGPLRRFFAMDFSAIVDARIIDGAVNGVASLVAAVARGLRRVQIGPRAQLRALDRRRRGRPAALPRRLGRAVVVTDFPILSAPHRHPCLGAIVILFLPGRRPEIVRAVGYAFTAATLGLAGYLLWNFETGHAGYQFVESERWIGSLGVKYVVGVDGISLFMVVLNCAALPDRPPRVGEDHGA